MPLSDFLSLSDDSLRAAYETQPVNKAAIRKPLIRALDNAIKQFEEGRTKVPNRIWSTNGDTVKFTPKLKGEPLAISGKAEHFIPAERFVEAVKNLIASVEAGELDDVLEGSQGSTGGRSTKSGSGSRAEKTFEQKLNSVVASAKRYGWDEKKTKDALKARGATPEQIKAALA